MPQQQWDNHIQQKDSLAYEWSQYLLQDTLYVVYNKEQGNG